MTGWEHHRWNGFDCAFRVEGDPAGGAVPLLTIHPIGVGLSGAFWNRFTAHWREQGSGRALLHPDLLGCGASAMPHRLTRAEDWAGQLLALLEATGKRRAVVVVQGGSLPIALELNRLRPGAVAAMVLVGPPSWELLQRPGNPRAADRRWRWFFDTPAGTLFYRYARSRGFLRSFSIRQLFDDPAAVDEEWLTTLALGSRDLASRFAVFSFLAGHWLRDWSSELRSIRCPVLTLFGEHASGIGRRSGRDSPQKKLADYGAGLADASGRLLPGRNVLPYESSGPFTAAVAAWLGSLPDRLQPDSPPDPGGPGG